MTGRTYNAVKTRLAIKNKKFGKSICIKNEVKPYRFWTNEQFA